MTHHLTIVGLGPGRADSRTIATQEALRAARRIILRTSIHPGVEDLVGDPRVTTCDDLYDRLGRFADVFESIAERVWAAARETDVVYAVPGHPLFAEQSVRLVLAGAERHGIAVRVLDAVSGLDAIATALGVDPFAEQVTLIDAVALTEALERDPFSGGHAAIDPARPTLVTQVYSAVAASATKLALARFFPDDHPILVIRAAGVPNEERVAHCPLFELDRVSVNHLTSVWIPATAPLDAHRAPANVQRIVARLRAPGGCPWDREQTHASLRNAVIEEAHEVVDAIDAGDLDHLAEELGDLLLQVLLHAQIAEEAGAFALEDVYQQVSRKLIRRHPHVFGSVTATTPGDVIATWNNVKAAERRARGQPDDGDPSHPLDRLPASMPATQRVAAVLRTSGPAASDRIAERTADEVGEQLLAAVAAAVVAGLDPERELERALRRRDDHSMSRSPVGVGQGRADA